VKAFTISTFQHLVEKRSHFSSNFRYTVSVNREFNVCAINFLIKISKSI
jgi:hypothetical protein